MRALRRFAVLLLMLGLILLLTLLSDFFGTGPGGEERSGESAARPEAVRPPAGRVLGADGGPPPAGTTVAAVGPAGRFEATVDPDGTFRLPAGAAPESFEVLAGSVALRTPAGAGTTEIRLPAALDLAGLVVDSETLLAVPGARITAGSASAECGENGRFRVEDVPLAESRLPAIRVEADGYEAQEISADPNGLEDLYVKLVRRP